MTLEPVALAVRRGPRVGVRWARDHPLAPRFGSGAVPLRIRSADGTWLAATRLVGPPDATATIVVAHGFTNSSRTPEMHQLATALARWADVVALDLRGHGASGGRSSLGVHEPDDVAAAIRAATVLAPGRPVVALGVSLGGAASLAAVGRGAPAVGVIAVSAPAWADLTSPAGRRLARWQRRAGGRALLRCLGGTRLDGRPGAPASLADLVGAISPGFVVVAHGPDDAVFGPEHARALFEWAHEPKSLWWVEGGGHGRSMLTDDLTARVRDEVTTRLREPLGARTD